MSNSVDVKNLIRHIAKGTVTENLCRICLLPLDNHCENIFTKICKEDQDYCIAHILELVFDMKIEATDKSNVCGNCFVNASEAYKLYLLLQRNNEILNFYVDHIDYIVDSIISGVDIKNGDKIGISVPYFEPGTEKFEYDLEGIALQNITDAEMSSDNESVVTLPDTQTLQFTLEENNFKVEEESNINDEIIIIMNDDGTSSYYLPQDDGTLKEIEGREKYIFNEMFIDSTSKEKNDNVRARRARNPMPYKLCTQCPTKYRFISKLKEHMKDQHNIDIFICKVCKDIIEDEDKYNEHIKQHGIHPCNICDMVFKRSESLVTHLEKHRKMEEMAANGAKVCDVCQYVLPDGESLHDHYDKKHNNKYTCYYCGRMYKGKTSFDMHIKKHEYHMMLKNKNIDSGTLKREFKSSSGQGQSQVKHMCTTCNRTFVDERSLMWHQRLHNNERPYVCGICDRAFVSHNRREQHALCAHSAPRRRCPLCPALFHLRSMVNSHIKKVHLRAHKRRKRTSKYADASWRTEPVPIQELSVAVQSELLELQTQRTDNPLW